MRKAHLDKESTLVENEPVVQPKPKVKQDYEITMDGCPNGLYRVSPKPAGAIPKALQGWYTTPDFAKEAITRYLAIREQSSQPQAAEMGNV